MSAVRKETPRPQLRVLKTPAPPAHNSAALREKDAPRPRTRGAHAIRWIEKHITCPNGESRGEPMRLLWWQILFIHLLFEIGATNDMRRFMRVLLLIPKKNGKSTLLAALALYLLLGDSTAKNPSIACGANSAEQANLVFGAAKEMVALSPYLSDRLECFAKDIRRKDNPEAKIIKVSRAIATNDGLFLTAIILDEIHEFVDETDEAFYTVLTNATIAAKQPLILLISTAGADLDTLCGRLYEHGKRVASGEVADPEFLFLCWEAPAGAAHDDPATWWAANPSYGVILNESGYRAKLNDPALTVLAFCRYFLNIWTRITVSWLPPGAWNACAAPDLALVPKADGDVPTFIGIDAATRYDSTAAVIEQFNGERYVQRARIWERPVIPTTGKPNLDWRLPLDEVAQFIEDACREYTVHAIGCDPAFMWNQLIALQEQGLPIEEISQSNARMIPAATRYYGDTVQGLMAHDGDPAFARQIANAVAKETIGGGWRLAKGKQRAKMDASVAGAMAHYLATRGEEPKEEEPKPAILFFDDEEVA